MKFSEHWLRQWVNPSLTTQALCDQMTLLGLSIDAIVPVAGQFSGVIVGEVLSTAPHPNAEKLTCCVVSMGGATPLHIVCGASNVRAGLRVAVATIGAVLPGDFKIKEAKLRGELSQGMLCSAQELQLQLGQTAQEGILELPKDAAVGDDFNAYFKANDHIIDVEITPNRGDCLSIAGLARDIAAVNGMSVTAHDNALYAGTFASLPVQVAAPSACPRYIGRVIAQVDNTRETPSFVQHALQRAGIRLINPVVDICNFVMLELGQPMHAFASPALHNKLTVRFAKHLETVTLLDERTIALTPDDLVIADDTEVHALAGIMGGLHSAVSAKTTAIFLEAAFFDPQVICLAKRRHHINTDSSYRFERGVDFNLPARAIARATALIIATVGGEVAELCEVTATEQLLQRAAIVLPHDQIWRILGIDIAPDAVIRILQSLGMTVSHAEAQYTVMPPSYRFDINLPVDLIEELARMTGYDNIPVANRQTALTMQPHSEAVLEDQRIRDFWVDRNYHEAMTYSFISPELFALFSPDAKPITLRNPLSQDMSVMRASIWPGLLQAIAMNVRHQCERVRLFETGLCFEADAQPMKLAVAITGSARAEQWREPQRPSDFYDLKAEIEALLQLADVTNHQWTAEIKNPALHPGRSCALMVRDQIVGFLGEVHPDILNYFAIRQPVIVCELALDVMRISSVPRYRAFSKFPSVRRDIALVLDESIQADVVRHRIIQEAGAQLLSVQIFDVYQGKGIAPGKKSIALGLTFQDPSRTLRDEEINAIIHGVVSVLVREFDATLRM